MISKYGWKEKRWKYTFKSCQYDWKKRFCWYFYININYLKLLYMVLIHYYIYYIYSPLKDSLKFEPTTTELSGYEFNLHSEPTLCTYSNFIVCSVSYFVQCRILFWILPSSVASLFELKVSWGNHMSVAEWANTCGIHHM